MKKILSGFLFAVRKPINEAKWPEREREARVGEEAESVPRGPVKWTHGYTSVVTYYVNVGDCYFQ